MGKFETGKGLTIMKPKTALILAALMVCASSLACGFSRGDAVVTVTQIAANIYGTQTATAPTATQTYTPSPTPTITPTPTATPTSTLTPSSTPTPTATQDPNIVFFDDFSGDIRQFMEWDDEGVVAEYSDGYFEIDVDGSTYFWTTSRKPYSDVSIDVDVKKISGSFSGQYGVICRLQDGDNYYVFLIQSDGTYGIWKLHEGAWSSLSSSDWAYNDYVINGAGAIDHITATCNGDTLTLKVNGSTLMDVRDDEFISGNVGMYAGAYDDAGVDVVFDNYTVTR